LPIDHPFARLVSALAAPTAESVLVGYQPPMAVLELPGQQAGIVAVDGASLDLEELKRRLARIMDAEQNGVLYVVVVGGGEGAKGALREADAKAPDPKKLSAYYLDGEGRLERLEGRRCAALEQAAGGLAAAQPLEAAHAEALITGGRREREEAIRFATQVSGQIPRVTYGLIAACVVIYALAMLWARKNGPSVLLLMGANSGPLVRAGEVWRLLASAFLHSLASYVHLIVNMLALYSFGSFLERVLGWRRYLVLYGASALGGAIASAVAANVYISRGIDVPPSVGASGAIWGLMLAGFALTRPRQTLFPPRIARQLRSRLLWVLVLNVGVSFLPFVDKFAHFGGGIIGFALMATGLLVPRAPGAPGDDPPGIKIAAWLTLAALAASVAIALLTGHPWAPRVNLPELDVL
jgi:rhomboid protease GluP